MKEAAKKHAKKLLSVTECDLKSAQRILGLSDPEILDKLPGRIDHITTNMQEVLNLMALEKVTQPELFENARPITLDLDPEVVTVGRVTINTNGQDALEEEVAEEDTVSA